MKHLGLISLLLILAQISFCATEYFVSIDGNDASNGLAWASAKASIQAAVDATIAGDIVTVSNGTYTTTVPALSYTLAITKAITVRSDNGPDVTIIDAGNVAQVRVAKVNAEGAVLNGFTLTKGLHSSKLDNQGPSALLLEAGLVTNCIISANTGYLLGAAYVNGGTLTDCVVRGNTATSKGPGGIEIKAGAVLNCTITNNTANIGNNGGGINVMGGVVSNCLIRANTSSALGREGGVGGGAYQTGGLIVNCEITDNMCYETGGGVYLKGGILRNSLLAGNTATIEGGGLYQTAGTVENCTLANNTTPLGKADGIWMSGGTISNSIAYLNNGKNIYQTGGSIAFSSITPLPAGIGNIDEDPDFIDAPNGDYRLSIFSPCIDVGSNQPWMDGAVDRDNNVRLYNSLVDLGAYERTSGAGSALQCTFSAPETSGFNTLDATFTAQVAGDSIDNVTYTWDFGDGASVSGTDKSIVNHPYETGYYTVMLTVSNEIDETATKTRVDYIKVIPPISYVSKNGSNIAPYESWARAAASVEDAVAVGSSTVLISNGTYLISGNGIAVTRDMTIRGVNGPEATILDAKNVNFRRIFWIDSLGARIEGITAAKGKWNERAYGGGAMRILSGLVTNCIVTDSGSYDHGAVYLGGGTLTDSVVRNSNSGSWGPGGISIDSGSVLNCTITNNTTGNNGKFGGGLTVAGGIVSNCLIRANSIPTTATAGNPPPKALGGGAYQTGGLIVNSEITDNVSFHFGGGLYQTGGILRNALLSGNTANVNGGGLYQTAGAVENCTIVDNTTLGDGDGIWMSGGSVSNSIAYFNGDDNLYTTGGTVDFSCITPLPAGAGNISGDPDFVDTLNGDYRLRDGSPCVNAGANQAWMIDTSDLDGNPRIGSRFVDMGAYEILTPNGALISIR